MCVICIIGLLSKCTIHKHSQLKNIYTDITVITFLKWHISTICKPSQKKNYKTENHSIKIKILLSSFY